MRITYESEADALSIVFRETTVTTKHLPSASPTKTPSATCCSKASVPRHPERPHHRAFAHDTPPHALSSRSGRGNGGKTVVCAGRLKAPLGQPFFPLLRADASLRMIIKGW